MLHELLHKDNFMQLLHVQLHVLCFRQTFAIKLRSRGRSIYTSHTNIKLTVHKQYFSSVIVTLNMGHESKHFSVIVTNSLEVSVC